MLPTSLDLAISVNDYVLLRQLTLRRANYRRLRYNRCQWQWQRYRTWIIRGGAALTLIEATRTEQFTEISEGIVLALKVLWRWDK